MGLTAFWLVLVSVFLHAGWNFLGKHQRSTAAFFLIAAMTSALLWLPVFCLARIDLSTLPATFWHLTLASGAFEVLYFIGLFQAYRRCDISLAYPMARALPVLLTALVTLAFGLGRPPGLPALVGMGVVAAGCLLMPLTRWSDLKPSRYRNVGMAMIVVAAIGTTGYTVVDSLSMVHLLDAGADSRIVSCGLYLFLIEALIVAGLGVYVLLIPDERAEFRRLFLKSPYPSISGLFSSGAYILILLAMGFVTNVSYLQAFRQMSLPLGVLAGVFWLKEGCAPIKLLGIALVVAGLVVVALGR